MRFPEADGHDTAQFCLNGHRITGSYHDFPDYRKRFCSDCGAPTIIACADCGTEIRGERRGGGFRLNRPVPAFCPECGTPYPWTEAKQQTAIEMIEELGDLTREDREALKGTIPDLVRETPRSELAAQRFRNLLGKAGKAAGDVVRKVVVDLAAEVIKKSL